MSYIVVGRDGRDAFMSWLNHMRNMRPEVVMRLAVTAADDGIELVGSPPVDDVHALFAHWLDERPMWFEQVASFWPHWGEANVRFVHYNEMQAISRPRCDGSLCSWAAFERRSKQLMPPTPSPGPPVFG